MSAHQKNKGASLLEVVIGAALVLIVLVGAFSAFNLFVTAGVKNAGAVAATYLLEEGMEALVSMRDRGWTINVASLPVNQTHYLEWKNGNYVATSSREVIGNFERSFKLLPVYRDGASKIAETGTLDANMRKITVTVIQNTATGTTTRSLSAYLGNIYEN